MTGQPLPAQDRIVGGVAQALVVPVRFPGGAFVGHAAFAHDIAGMGIVGVVAGFNAVEAHFLKLRQCAKPCV